MVIFVMAMAAVIAALSARTCFANAGRTAGLASRRSRYHGAFYSAGASALVGLALFARSPGFALAALAACLAFLVWGLRLRLAAPRPPE